MHARWRKVAPSNNTLLVVECDGPIDAHRLRLAMDRLLAVCPWPAARLRRGRPWGRLHWVARERSAPTPPIRHRIAGSPEAAHRELEAELNAAIDARREPPLRVLLIDIASRGEGTTGMLVLSWFHPLMDPRGAQNLLGHLADCDAGDAAAIRARHPGDFGSPRDMRPLRERARVARRSIEHMRAMGLVPPVSPGTGCTSPGLIRFRQSACSGDDASRPGWRGTREIAWRLAVVGGAMADLWRRRGLPDTPFLVPVSVDLRPKGEPGATFGNCLAFHFARFKPSDTTDIPALARALRDQMVQALRDGQIEANAAGMEFLHYRPISMMLRELPWTATGESFSFNCADIGEVPPEIRTLFGRRVVNAYHVPVVLPRPGIGVFFNRCAGTNNLVVSWVEGAVGEDEAARVMDMVREGMGWTAVG